METELYTHTGTCKYFLPFLSMGLQPGIYSLKIKLCEDHESRCRRGPAGVEATMIARMWRRDGEERLSSLCSGKRGGTREEKALRDSLMREACPATKAMVISGPVLPPRAMSGSVALRHQRSVLMPGSCAQLFHSGASGAVDAGDMAPSLMGCST